MYLKLYRRVAGSGAFIDGFAGTGQGRITRDGLTLTVDGSGLIAVKSSAFSTLDLIELGDESFDSLSNTVARLTKGQQSKIRLHKGDCNQVIPQLLANDRLDPGRPCFALLDQESTQLEWATIENLASWKTYRPPASLRGRPKECKVELWILFNSHQVVNRLWPHDRGRYPDSFSPPTLDRLMGGREAWRDLWDERKPASFLVHRFADRLRELGYVYVIPQVVRDPESNRPQYHMLHATDHPSAVTLMRWAKRATSGFEDVRFPGLE